MEQLYISIDFTSALYVLIFVLLSGFLCFHILLSLFKAADASIFLLLTSSASPINDPTFLAFRQVSLDLSLSLLRVVYSVLSLLVCRLSFPSIGSILSISANVLSLMKSQSSA